MKDWRSWWTCNVSVNQFNNKLEKHENQCQKWKFKVRKYILKGNMKLYVIKIFLIVPKAPIVTYEIL